VVVRMSCYINTHTVDSSRMEQEDSERGSTYELLHKHAYSG
jgi:hypothetical protein